MVSQMLVTRVLQAAVLITLLLSLPLKFMLPKHFLLKKDFAPKMGLDALLPFNDSMPTAFNSQVPEIAVGPLGYLLVVRLPLTEGQASSDDLVGWYQSNQAWMQDALLQYGGVLLRGFPIASAQAFEDLLAAAHPACRSRSADYLDDGVRQQALGTAYSAESTAASAAHLRAPSSSTVHLFALQPSRPGTGQLVLADFRQVWRELPDALKSKLDSRGLLFQRRLLSNASSTWPLDDVEGSWQAIFGSSDQDQVDALAADAGFTTSWDPEGNLLLSMIGSASRAHPLSGDLYLSAPLPLLHAASALAPMAFAAQLLDDHRLLLPYFAQSWLRYLRQLLRRPQGVDVMLSDQAPLPLQDGLAVQQAVHKQSWVLDWQAGDLLVLDNQRIGSGRLPSFSRHRPVIYAARH